MAPNTLEPLRLLVVSSEVSVLRLLGSIAQSNSWHLETSASGWDAMERVQSDTAPHLLLLDLPRGNGDGLHLLPWLRRQVPEPAQPSVPRSRSQQTFRRRRSTTPCRSRNCSLWLASSTMATSAPKPTRARRSRVIQSSFTPPSECVVEDYRPESRPPLGGNCHPPQRGYQGTVIRHVSVPQGGLRTLGGRF